MHAARKGYQTNAINTLQIRDRSPHVVALQEVRFDEVLISGKWTNQSADIVDLMYPLGYRWTTSLVTETSDVRLSYVFRLEPHIYAQNI